LGGSGFVVDIASIDLSALIEEIFGNFDGARKMERSLTISTAGVDEIGIRGEARAQFVDQPKTSGSMGSNGGAALDGVSSQVGFGRVEEAKTSSPPAAPGVDVGARREQNIEHLTAAGVNDCGRVERANGVIDASLKFGALLEEPLQQSSIIFGNGLPAETDRFGLRGTRITVEITHAMSLRNSGKVIQP